MVSQLGPAIDVRTTFRHERDLLIDLLRKLDKPEWTAATVCPGWSVRDVAGHLLHDDLRRLSRTRDGVQGPVPAADESLPTFLNRANDRWVEETRFLSPRLLIDLRTCINWAKESGGPVSTQLLSGWMWHATTAKTGFTTSRSATPLNGQDSAR